MSSQTQLSSPSRAPKRARPDHSASASPARQPLPTRDEANLPAFLRQSRLEINAKFEELNSQQLLRLEESRTDTELQSRWAIDNSPGNRLRNRYLDVRPWDKQRIKLQVPEGASDYINASPISLLSPNNGDERKYIATQGPKQAGVDHFWQMVWEQVESPAVIVMLTQLAEGFREKCYQYFPEDMESEGMLLNFADAEGNPHSGTIQVVETTYDEESKTTVRKLVLTFDTSKKTIYHLLFLAWPDHGVPENMDRAALLSLIKLSREKNEGSWTNPRIVHCSAGVGRSGTFIALEHLLEELEQGQWDDNTDETASTLDSSDPIFDTVHHLREQRMMMVQSDLQYAFLYDILADAYRERHRDSTQNAADDDDDDNTQSTVEKVTSATARLTPLGEPSPKAIRLSRGLRKIYQDIRSRSLSRKRSEEEAAAAAEKKIGGRASSRPGSEPPNGRITEGERESEREKEKEKEKEGAEKSPLTPLTEVQSPTTAPADGEAGSS